MFSFGLILGIAMGGLMCLELLVVWLWLLTSVFGLIACKFDAL